MGLPPDVKASAATVFSPVDSQTVFGVQGVGSSKESKTAIILASFGTTVPSGVKDIVNIQKKIEAAFPGIPVHNTFTSSIIRAVWKKRQAEPQRWLEAGVPRDMLFVKNIISTFGDLLEDGCRNIIVQPTHIFFMEQSHDLKQYVAAMRSIRTIKSKWQPFDRIAIGRPALGTIGPRYDYVEDLARALATVAPDVELAEKEQAALVYMAHGNEFWPSGIFFEAEKKMRAMYPEVFTCFGVVEGSPGIADVVQALEEVKSRLRTNRVVIKPFMIVAGDHALNDMTGTDEGSWGSLLAAAGYQVVPVLKGLGANDDFAGLFVDHIRDAAAEVGIVLP